MSLRRPLTLLSLLALVASLLALTPAAPARAQIDVTINEVRIDDPGADEEEFFELHGPASQSLDGYTYIVLGDGTGGSGVVEYVLDLAGQAIPADGFFVVATSAFTLDTADLTAGLVFENSDNVTHLLVENFSGVVGDDLDTNDDGVLDTTPWTAEADRLALIEEDNPPSDTEYHYGPPTVGPDGSFVPGHAYACADGSDTYVIGAFDPAGGNDTPGAPNDCDGLVINEVDADTPSNDTAEFIELFDGGAGSTSLDGLVVVLFNGSVDTSYEAIDLDGHSTDADGFFVIGNPAVANVDLVLDPGSGGAIQNGADAAALYTADAEDFPDGTAVTATDLLDAIVYDTNDMDDSDLIDVLTPGNPQVNEDENGNKDNESSSRCPDGGAPFDTATFTQVVPSPGASNACGGGGSLPGCYSAPPAVTRISCVQGDGPSSPLPASTPVTVEGIVTGLQQDNDALDGFHVQEQQADEDGDPTTSEALFVFCNDTSGNCPAGLATGDAVTVTGNVSEFSESTQITVDDAADTTIVSTGNPLPPTRTVDLSGSAGSTQDAATFEALESMLVDFETLVVTEFFELARFGSIVLTDGTQRPYQYTHDRAPSVAGYQAYLDELSTRQIVLDDDNNNENDALDIRESANVDANEPYPYPTAEWPPNQPDEGLSVSNPFRGGEVATDLAGVMDWDFGAWRIRPVEGFDYTFQPSTRPDVPDVGGDLVVAGANVLNYFPTADGGTPLCGPNGDQDCRGADSEAELIRQRDKIVAMLAGIGADVVGLIEIENDDTAVQDLVDALNDEMGANTYAQIDTGSIGTDAIKVAFIYRPATVVPVGDHAILDSTDDPDFRDEFNRPVLIQTFRQVSTGGVFTAAVNHLKSKGSPCDAVEDESVIDGQANCSQTRTDAAEALASHLATDPTGSGDPDFLIIGDLNAYRMEDPIVALEAAGYTDLIDTFAGAGAYSYLFDQLGYLDHALASDDLLSQVTDAGPWNINADEPMELDYNDVLLDSGERDFDERSDARPLYEPDPYRASDHDPIVIGLDLDEDPPGNGGGNGGGTPTDPPVDPTEPPVDPAEGASIREACDDDATCTSVTVSQLTFTAGNRSLFHQIVPGITATEALLASDLVFADALASGTLQDTRPLLLNDPTELEPIVLAELRRVGVEDVWILGGTAAVSQDVEDALVAEGFSVTRLAGPTRLETAQEIAEAAGDVQPTLLARAFGTAEGTDPTQAFADSLAVGGWAADDGRSVLLTETAQLSGSTEAWLESSAGSSSTLVGGVAALAEAVADAVRGLGLGVDRVAGATRFETAVEVARARGFEADAPAATVIISEGQAEDAWEAGFTAAGAAVFDAPILLANGDDLPQPTLDFLGTAVAADAEVVCLASQVACDAAIAAIAGTG